MVNLIKAAAVRKSDLPKKPRPDFPLFPHATGRWAKKVRGQTCYFGKIADDPKGEAALNQWLDKKDELLTGRKPRAPRDGLTMRELCNRFLTWKKSLRDSKEKEIGHRQFGELHATCEMLIKAFKPDRLVIDLTPDDFERLRASMSCKWGAARLSGSIQRCRSIFKYAFDSELIDRTIRFGPGFKKPSKSVMRKLRNAAPARMFEPDELRSLVEGAGVPLRAMILLGANCGLGNGDIAALPQSAVNLATAWLDFPRPKTGIARRAPLWPETVEALRAAKALRPAAKDPSNDGLFFLTKYGQPWTTAVTHERKPGKVTLVTNDALAKEFNKLLRLLKLNRPRLGFYGLRHTFRTIADEKVNDRRAIDRIMGHGDESMAEKYVERIEDSRLQAVVDHVRTWLALPAQQSDESPATLPMNATAG